MGFGTSSFNSGRSELPEEFLSSDNTLLETLTSVFAPIEAVDVSTRSLVRGIQTGESKFFKNIGRALVPGGKKPFRVSGKEILGTTSELGGLAAELLVSPFNLLSGVGVLTKGGKARKILKAATTRAKAAQILEKGAIGLGRVEAANLHRSVKLAEVSRARDVALVAAQEGPNRALLRLGLPFLEKSLGTVDITLPAKLPQFTLKTTMAAKAAEKKITKLSAQLARQTRLGREEKIQPALRHTKILNEAGEPAHVFNAGGDGLFFKDSPDALGKNIYTVRIDMKRPIYMDRPLPTNVQKLMDEGLNFDAAAKKLGYDGVVGRGGDNYRVFKASQVHNPFGRFVNTMQRDLEAATKQAADGRGILSPFMVSRINKLTNFIGKKFGHTAGDPLIQALNEMRQTGIARMQHEFVSDELVRFQKELDDLGEVSQVDLASAIEYRQWAGKTADLGPVRTARINDLQKVYAKKIKDAKKAGDDVKVQQKLAFEFQGKVQSIKEDFVINELGLARIAKTWGRLSPDVQAFAVRWYSKYDRMIEFEQKMGINIEKLLGGKASIAYFERLPTKEATAFMNRKKMTLDMVVHSISSFMRPANKRMVYPELALPELNDILRETFKLDFDFFDSNAVRNITTRTKEHITAVNNAEFGHAVSKFFGQSGLKKDDSVPVSEFFESMGLRADSAPDLRISKRDMSKIKRANGLIMEEVEKTDSAFWRTIHVLDNSVNFAYRMSLTTFFPAFHHRNALSNMVLMGLDPEISVGKIPSAMLRAMNLQKGAFNGTLNASDKKLWDSIAAHRILNRGIFSEFGEQLAKHPVLKEIVDRPLTNTVRKIKELIGGNQEAFLHPTKTPVLAFDPLVGRAYGEMIENNARIASFIMHLDEGKTPLEAMARVNEFLFDYTLLTPFERARVKPFFLFYTWMRNNIPLMMKTSIQNPRVLHYYNSVFGLDDEEVPNYLRGAMGLNLGDGNFIGSLGIPLEDLLFLNVKDADPNTSDQIKRMFQRGASRLAPPFRLLSEMITGETAYTRRPLANQSLVSFRDGEFRGLLVENSPFSRLFRTVGRGMDSETELGIRMLDLFTGVKTYRMDPKRVTLDRIKRKRLQLGAQRLPIVADTVPKEELTDLQIRLRKAQGQLRRQ